MQPATNHFINIFSIVASIAIACRLCIIFGQRLFVPKNFFKFNIVAAPLLLLSSAFLVFLEKRMSLSAGDGAIVQTVSYLGMGWILGYQWLHKCFVSRKDGKEVKSSARIGLAIALVLMIDLFNAVIETILYLAIDVFANLR